LKFAAMKKMPRNATASGRIGRKNSAAVLHEAELSSLSDRLAFPQVIVISVNARRATG